MKFIKYIILAALAVATAACGDNDPSVMIDDYDVTYTVSDISYNKATVDVTWPALPFEIERLERGKSFYNRLEIVEKETNSRVWGRVDGAQLLPGNKIRYRVTDIECQPGHEYIIYYRGYIEEDSYLPLVELGSFKTLGLNQMSMLKATLRYSLVEDKSAIIWFDLPQSVESSNLNLLLSTSSDMSNPQSFVMSIRDYRISQCVGIGNLLKPNTKYYFQLAGDFRVDVNDYGTMSFENAKTSVIEFTTNDTHLGMFDGAWIKYDDRNRLVAGFEAYQSEDICVGSSYGLSGSFYTSDTYQTWVSESNLVAGTTYYPVLAGSFYLQYIYDNGTPGSIHFDAFVVPTPATLTIQ